MNQRDTIRNSAARTSQCIPLERLGQLTDADRRHLEVCARCRTEQTLWQQFSEAEPGEHEGAAVQWISAELKRRAAVKQEPRRDWLAWLKPLRTTSGAIATVTVLFIGAAGLVATRDSWGESYAPPSEIYRSVDVAVTAPKGDLNQAPSELAWRAVSNAASYHVRVIEVDNTLLWQQSATSTTVSIPESVRRLAVPGKTLLWSVVARDRNGGEIAKSSAQSFRVRPKNVPQGE